MTIPVLQKDTGRNLGTLNIFPNSGQILFRDLDSKIAELVAGETSMTTFLQDNGKVSVAMNLSSLRNQTDVWCLVVHEVKSLSWCEQFSSRS